MTAKAVTNAAKTQKYNYKYGISYYVNNNLILP
jgi:hypothetical protein